MMMSQQERITGLPPGEYFVIAIDDIEAIVRVPGVDACLIAPFDLAMSYGYRDGPDHDEVQAATARADAMPKLSL